MAPVCLEPDVTEPVHPDDCDDETYLVGRAEKYGQPRQHAGIDVWSNGRAPMRRTAAMRLLGPVLYAFRLPDGLIKIGHTTDLNHRFNDFSGSQVLAFKPGTRADEAAAHRSLGAHVARGREYYHPSPEVLALVNEWRAALGREPLDR